MREREVPELLVARGGIEPPTYRFSGGRSYQRSYLAVPHCRAQRGSKDPGESSGHRSAGASRSMRAAIGRSVTLATAGRAHGPARIDLGDVPHAGDAVAVHVLGVFVFGEVVQRVVLVGDLGGSVRTGDRAEFVLLDTLARSGRSDQWRPGGGTLVDACALLGRVRVVRVERVTGRADKHLALFGRGDGDLRRAGRAARTRLGLAR